MIIQKLPSKASAVLTISTVAKTLQEFITAADSPASDGFDYIDGANYCVLVVQAKDIRYTIDGNAPTVSSGTIAFEGDVITLKGQELDKVQMIRNATDDATVEVNAVGIIQHGEF